MVDDTLSILLEINDQQADVVLDKFKEKFKAFGYQIDEVSKKKIIDERNAVQIDLLEAKTYRLKRALEEVSKVETKKGFDVMASSADKAAVRVGVIKNELSDLYKKIQEGASKPVLAQFIKEAKTLENELDRIKSKTERLNLGGNNPPPSSNSGANDITGSLLNKAALLYAAREVYNFGKESLTAATEGANAQRVLRAEVKESGISFEQLSAEAKKFGEITLLSNREAETSFAAIEKFATRAGRAGQGAKISTAIADLAAARGISPGDIKSLTAQLENGGSRVFEKLLSQKPKEFSTGIDGITKSLTEAEKESRNFDELLKESALFKGEAEKRANDSASAVTRLGKTYEDLKEKIGAAIIPLVEFTSKVPGAFSSDKSNNPTVNEFRKLADVGVNRALLLPFELIINGTDNLTKGLSNIIAGNDLQLEQKIAIKYSVDFGRAIQEAEALRKSDGEIAKAKENPFGSFDNFALSKVDISKSFFSEKERDKAIADARLEAQRFVDKLKKEYQKASASGDSVTIAFAKKELEKYGNLFDADTKDGFTTTFATKVSENLVKKFQLALKNPDSKLSDLRNILSEVNKSNDLTSDAREGLQDSITSKINESIKQAQTKVKELGKTYESVFDALNARQNSNNPFVSLFTEADKSLFHLRENTKGLSKDLISSFEKIEEKQNQLNLFNTRLANNLNIGDLKNSAEDFRTAKPSTKNLAEKVSLEAENAKLTRQIEEANFYAEKFNPNNPKNFYDSKYSFFQRERFGDAAGSQRNGESNSDYQKRVTEAVNLGIKIDESITEIKRLNATSLSATGVYGKNVIADEVLKNIPSREELLSQLSSPYLQTRENAQFLLNQQSESLAVKKDFNNQNLKDSIETQNRISNRIDEKINIINTQKANFDENSPEAQSARRQLIAISSGLNPSELTARQREQFASAREREAVRLEQSEADARENQKLQIKIQGEINDNLKKLRELAEKEGAKGIEKLLVEVVDKDNIANVRQVKSPTPKNTEDSMKGSFGF